MGRTTTSFKTEGFKDLDFALGEIGKVGARGVLRRVGKMALAPIASRMQSLVRVDQGQLRDSIGVGTKLTKRQAKFAKKETKSFSETYAGAGGLAQAITEEFGTISQSAHAFARPAWDGGKAQVLTDVGDMMGVEIAKTAARQARKAAKIAAKIGAG